MVCIKCGIGGYVTDKLPDAHCVYVPCCGVAACVRVNFGTLVCGLPHCECGHARCLATHAKCMFGYVTNVGGMLVVVAAAAKT
eukprot:360210-Chlamydomonas_euryale.AAC.3